VSSDRAVLNASPIITLCKSGQEDLLPQLFTVIGTVGLIVLAKRRGLIALITPGLEALRDAGSWLSDKLIEQLKRQEGE
jgi:Domain of unknown function (DUF3368)